MTSYTCEPTGFCSKSESSSESCITFVISTSIALSHPQALVHFRLLGQNVHLLSFALTAKKPQKRFGARCVIHPGYGNAAYFPSPAMSLLGQVNSCAILIVRAHNMFIYSILTWGGGGGGAVVMDLL